MDNVVKVKRDGPRGWHWIDAAKFDPSIHELHDEAPDEPKTAVEVLAMGADKSVHFKTFEAEAAKLLGDKMPAKKADIIAALEELATNPE